MAALFRNFMSSREPLTTEQLKKKDPSPQHAADMTREENNKSADRKEDDRTTHSSRKKHRFWRLKNHRNNRAPVEDQGGSSVIASGQSEPVESPTGTPVESLMYFNHPMEEVGVREANRIGSRDSYVTALSMFARNAPGPELGEEITQIIESAQHDITSPKSAFDDWTDSDDEEHISPQREGRFKKPIHSLKVSTSQLFARSRADVSESGSGREVAGSAFALGFSGIDQVVAPEVEQVGRSPVVGSPTGFRRMNAYQEWEDLRQSPSLSKKRNKTNLKNWFWGDSPPSTIPGMSRSQTSLVRQHPSVLEGKVAGPSEPRAPASLARRRKREETPLPAIAESPAEPALRRGDVADDAVSNSSSFYSDNVEPAALPAPLRVVKKASEAGEQHLRVRRTPSGTVLRTPSFLRNLEEESQRRRALQHSTSHPAIRGLGLAMPGLFPSTSGPPGSEMQQRSATPAPPVPPFPATAPLPQRPFGPASPALAPALRDFFARVDPKLTPDRQLRDRPVGNAFLQQTRREDYGLEPFQLSGKNEPRHPRHPLKWATRSLMCASKHLTIESPKVIPDEDLPPMPADTPTRMRDLEFKMPEPCSPSSSTSSAALNGRLVAAAQQCPLCSSFCCLYIELLHFLPPPTPPPGPLQVRHADVAEQGNKIRASAQATRLQQRHPNGLDKYDMFVTCGDCAREVCPGCAKKCEEALCGEVVCTGCGGECGVH